MRQIAAASGARNLPPAKHASLDSAPNRRWRIAPRFEHLDAIDGIQSIIKVTNEIARFLN
ncbi:hypothetical protein [Cupriavidus sp. M-11]|uniref:hypothetical protein n=1 Tax=Cupriavidus sp. M-11 TaxID=3233038 RepID=UPI003F910A0A